MRTARSLGMETVAVYSDADREAPHVKQADFAVCIGPAAATESYLVADNVIDAALKTSSDAIHPGYGFLSENAAFANDCAEAGLIFIGPSAEAIELMGDKARAKEAMLAAGVPCVPGYHSTAGNSDQATDNLSQRAIDIGLPVMIKAAAGGGGRGMRLVSEQSQLAAAIDTARSEAINAFGAGELILEKAVIRPRHVEIQVFGDHHGNTVYLGERDCSVQRRHQKVIEEAPCPILSSEQRIAMGEAAVKAAETVSYVGAGTVEFLLGQDGEFYFLEMNTRLQVEHPVTEATTGLDLVALQLRVAAGEALGIHQADVPLMGHAIEVRLCAEEPESDFLPSTGRISRWVPPTGAGIRVDAGIETGGEVSPFYDSMIAKVIAYGETRDDARRRLIRALSESALFGPSSNRDFLIDALNRRQFANGEATTAFVDEEYPDGFSLKPTQVDLAIAAVAQYKQQNRQALESSPGVNPELLNWSSAAGLESVYQYRIVDDLETLVVSPDGLDCFHVRSSGGTECEIQVLASSQGHMMIEIGYKRESVLFHQDTLDPSRITLATDTLTFTVFDVSNGELQADVAGDGAVLAPMHGQLLHINVEVGDQVAQGESLAMLEAMKMQHEIPAPVGGEVTAIHCKAGAQVAANSLLIEISPTDKDE